MDNKIMRTLVKYQPQDYNPFIVEPLFVPGSTEFFLDNQGEEEPVRLSRIVFRKKGTEEWVDDPVRGWNEATVLCKDAEPEPATLLYIGDDPKKVVSLVEKNEKTITFATAGLVIPGARCEDEVTEDAAGNDEHHETYTLDRAAFAGGASVEVPLADSDPIHLAIPFEGFAILDGEGKQHSGNMQIPFSEIMDYTYKFKANGTMDRFTISFNNDKMIYQYILTDEGTLSIRSKRDHMDKVGEMPAEGRLALLLQGIPNAVIKLGNQRWRIEITE